MCRLCAITATDVPNRNIIFHEMMTLSRHDENQADGFGVWGRAEKAWFVHKNHRSYDHADLSLYGKIRADHFIVGHVRKSSTGTEISQRASHPFMFLHDDKYVDFIGAHNGRVSGIPFYTADVKTDTYAAFKKLHESTTGFRLSKSTLESWISTFEDDSAFCFMITQLDKLFVIKGPLRTMSLARIGNGYIFHTNPDVIERLGHYTKHMLGIEIGEIYSVGDKTMITVKPGSSDLEVEEMTYTMIPRITHYPVYKKEKKDFTYHGDSIVSSYKDIRDLLNPMRMDHILNYVNYYLRTDNLQWSQLERDQRESFLGYIVMNPLTSEQRRMIDKWNVAFARGEDKAWQNLFFEKPFWMYDYKTLMLFFDETSGKKLLDFNDFDIIALKTLMEYSHGNIGN